MAGLMKNKRAAKGGGGLVALVRKEDAEKKNLGAFKQHIRSKGLTRTRAPLRGNGRELQKRNHYIKSTEINDLKNTTIS